MRKVPTVCDNGLWLAMFDGLFTIKTVKYLEIPLYFPTIFIK